MEYAFVSSDGTLRDLNLFKAALAAEFGRSLEDYITTIRVRAINATTLPANPAKGFAQLMALPVSSSFSSYAGYMAVSLGDSWLFVPPSALETVSQDYRAAQYSYDTTSQMWVEVVTDPEAEGGSGERGPVGEAGDPVNNVKLPGAGGVTRSGRVIASPKNFTEFNSFYGLDQGEPGLIPGRILVGFPILHVSPPTGAEYYLVCRPDIGAGSENTRGNFGASLLRVNRNIGTVLPVNSRVRFVGMCTEDREVTTAAQDTTTIPYKYSTDCLIRENNIVKDHIDTSELDPGARTGRTHSGVYMVMYRPLSGIYATEWSYLGMGSSPTNSSRGAHSTTIRRFPIYIDTGQRFTTENNTGTRMLHFREQADYQLLGA